MLMLRTLARCVVPGPVRRFIRDRWRSHRFGRALRVFAALGPDAAVPIQLLDELVGCWGNDWSAQSEYLASILNHLPETSGPVLECGSGLSTLLVGVRCGQFDREVWALEHFPVWADRVEAAIRRGGVPAAHICRTTIRSHGEYDWYDPAVLPPGMGFGLVVCDGPPGDTRGGRYGLLPVLRGRLLPGCRIYVDDAARPDEQKVLTRWQSEFGAICSMHGQVKPFAVVSLPGSTAAEGES